MNIIKVEEKHVCTRFVNEDTGEILFTVEHSKSKPKVAPFDKYVGIDVKHPSDCLTKEDLIESLSVMDAYVSWCKTNADSKLILEAIVKGYLQKAEASLLNFLSDNLTGWNYYIGTMDELSKCGVDKTNLHRVLSKLNPNLVRVVSTGKPKRGVVILQVNPNYMWKGDLQYRDRAAQTWYTGKLELTELGKLRDVNKVAR